MCEGVKWHDGEPFAANEVKCTRDLPTGKSSERLRLDPRKSWYRNLKEITTDGDYEVTFHLQPPAGLCRAARFRLFGGLSVPRVIRRHAAASDRCGPFKLIEFKLNERITVTQNHDYWRKGRPYFDGIESTIIRGGSTANLAFVAAPPIIFYNRFA